MYGFDCCLAFVARCSPARRRGYAKATACLTGIAGLDSPTAPAGAKKDNYYEKYKDTLSQPPKRH